MAAAVTHHDQTIAAAAAANRRRPKHKLRAPSTQKRSTTYAKQPKRSGGCELARRQNDGRLGQVRGVRLMDRPQ